MPHFIHIGRIVSRTDWYNLHPVHANHELAVIISGKLHLEDSSGHEWLLEQGTAVIYPAGNNHYERSSGDCPAEIYYTVFEMEDMPWQGITVKPDAGTALRPLVSMLFENFSAGAGQDVLDAFVDLMLKIFGSPPVSFSNCPRSVSARINEMSRSPSSSYTLEGLAEAAGMSKYHFLRIFRKYTGMTPFAMLNQIRCREALALLECTDLPVKIIAQRAGFADSSHMRKRLLEYSGSAPGRLRKKHC